MRSRTHFSVDIFVKKSLVALILFVAAMAVAVNSANAQKVVGTFKTGENPVGIAVDSATDLIFVANFGLGNGNTVSVIDRVTFELVETIRVDQGPGGVVINPDTRLVYVSNTGLDVSNTGVASGKTVSVIDGLSLEVLETITVGNGPAGIAVNIAKNFVYVANTFSGTINAIDAATNEVVEQMAVGSAPVEVRVNPLTGFVYVTNSRMGIGKGTLSVIPDTEGRRNKDITVNVGSGPGGLGINPLTEKAYVANFRGDNVNVIDLARNHRVIKTIPVGKQPGEIGVNTVTNRIFVANSGNNSVSLIDGEIDEVVDTVNVGARPAGIAVDLKNNMVYVTNVESNSVTVIKDEAPVVGGEPGANPTPTPIRELTELAVDPTTSEGWRGRARTAFVFALDQDKKPLPGVNIAATASGADATVTPASGITDASGLATFNYKFSRRSSDGLINFTAENLSVSIRQN